MPQLPRIAIGSTQPNSDCDALIWALMRLLADDGLQVQHFLSRACFSPRHGALAASGNSSRHLDSWLMSPAICRETFLRGVRDADFAIVEGHYPVLPRPSASHSVEAVGSVGGSLDALCDCLELPRLGVVDVSRLDDCVLPDRPPKLDGLLLDGFHGDRQYRHWQANFEALWGVPVFGGLGAPASLRQCVDRMPCGETPGSDLCDELARQLTKNTDISAIRRLAASRQLPCPCGASSRCVARPVRIRIAMALDEAFNCYFPDTLDLLEMLGATVVDFSPLRDESLPDDVDVVYFGCGHPERCAESLSANQCMMTSIRRHLCAGRRLYAEGGGLAYLCQHIETPGGQSVPMLGALPAAAKPNPRPAPPSPVELKLARSNWLADEGATLRGYLNTSWQIEPTAPLIQFAAAPERQLDLIGQYQAIGSRLHLNFAAQPEFLGRFTRRCSSGTRSAPA